MAKQNLSVEEAEALVERGIEEIAVTAASLADAGPRAGRFLTRVAVLTDFLRYVEDEAPKHQTKVNMVKAQAILRADGKGIMEKKTMAEGDPEYNQALESQGEWESLHNWVKNHIKNFENAHVMYRQYANAMNGRG